MANTQLIQMAKDLGNSQGFNMGGELAAQNLQKWAEVAQGQITERKAVIEKSNAKVAHYMENIPSGKGLPKIPKYAQEKVGQFLSDNRDAYAKHANAIRGLDPQDVEYQDHVSEMNRIKGAFDNLNDQFNTLLEQKTDYMVGVEEQSVSMGNKPGDIDFLANVYTDAADMAFDENGNVLFHRDGGFLGVDELPKWTEVNHTIPSALTKLSVQYYSKGIDITGPIEANLRTQVESIVKSKGRAGLISLASDNSFAGGEDGLGLPDDLLHDPEQTKELTKVVVDNWMEAIKSHSAEGKRQQEAEWKAKHPVKPVKPKNSLDSFFQPPIDPSKQ